MTQEIKDEVIEQLELDIKIGFENEDELFDSIRDMFYEEEDFDEKWLKQAISERYRQHQQDSLTWTRPTDFDRLVKTFDELIEQKIVCLHNAGFTKQDGTAECMEVIKQLNKLDIKANGFCYYHSQDLARAVDPDMKNLYLGFDSPTQEDNKALEIGKQIVESLTKNGFQISWAETVEQRIEIKDINWQKVPDGEEWGPNRMIRILKSKKPFWKFW